MIKIVNKTLVVSKKVKPVIGDLMLCHAVGIKDRFNRNGGKNIGEKWYITKHDGSPKSKLGAICHETEKIVFIFGFLK